MIELITNQYNSIVFLIIFVLFFPLFIYLGNKINISTSRATLLLLWHTFFSLVYFIYTFYFISDAKVYYIRSLSYDTFLYLGSTGIDYILSILRLNLKFQYLTIFLIFSLLGSIGLLLLDSLIKDATLNSSNLVKKILSCIVLLPSISFWSSAIGKDSLAFLSVCLFLFSLIKLEERNILFYIALAIMFFIRPHITILYLFSAFIYYLFSKNLNKTKSLTNFVIIILFTFALVPFSLQFAGVLSIDEFWQLDINLLLKKISLFTDHRQSLNLLGNSSVNIKEMTLFEKLFTYYFRPQIYEANNVFAFVSSIDNLLILLLFVFWILNICFYLFIKKIIFTKINLNVFLGILVYIIAISLILSSTTSNLGIAVRQKWMVLPFLLYLIIVSSKSLHYEKK